jgi:hypothetical protein
VSSSVTSRVFAANIWAQTSSVFVAACAAPENGIDSILTFDPDFKENAMNFRGFKMRALLSRSITPAAMLACGVAAVAGAQERGTFVLTSTNNAQGNAVAVFRLTGGEIPSLELAYTLPTGGKGGASGNAGIVQFKDDRGAVANYGSNTVSQLVRRGDRIGVGETIQLAPDCTKPDSVALTRDHLFVVGANCAESHTWPEGHLDGAAVSLTDNSAAQIAVGRTWAAVTMTSGSVLQLPLTHEGGALNGTSNPVTLPDDANNTPLGEAFWGDLLGFDPAHSADSLALVNASAEVFPIVGPMSAYPSNAPCWLAKGPLSIWYAGNSPGMAVSIFFSDAQGGEFYKSVPLPGVPTDITVSRDQKWLAVIYTAADGAHVAVFSIDERGDLKNMTTSPAIGAAAFSGVAFSE